jgi:hypothetical protein
LDEIQNDWVKILQKIKLNFLIVEVRGAVFDRKLFSRYEPKFSIDDTSFVNISRTLFGIRNRRNFSKDQKIRLDFL